MCTSLTSLAMLAYSTKNRKYVRTTSIQRHSVRLKVKHISKSPRLSI